MAAFVNGEKIAKKCERQVADLTRRIDQLRHERGQYVREGLMGETVILSHDRYDELTREMDGLQMQVDELNKTIDTLRE